MEPRSLYLILHPSPGLVERDGEGDPTAPGPKAGYSTELPTRTSVGCGGKALWGQEGVLLPQTGESALTGSPHWHLLIVSPCGKGLFCPCR